MKGRANTEIVFTPEDFKKMSSDKIATFIRQNINTAIVGLNFGIDRHIIRFSKKEDWLNYQNPY